MKMFVFDKNGSKVAFPAKKLMTSYWSNETFLTSLQFEDAAGLEILINDFDGEIFKCVVEFCASSKDDGIFELTLSEKMS